MEAWIKYPDLRPGDYFLADSFYEGVVGRVRYVREPVGAPLLVLVGYTDLSDGRDHEGTYNAGHVTKYLRPGETDPRLNIGRG